MKFYCRICQERIVAGSAGWYALGKLSNPDWGDPLECENYNGHEPR